MKKLDLGCGRYKQKGYTSVDNNPLVKPDILMDLNNPKHYSRFKTNSIDEIRMSHVLEHLIDPFSLMVEFHRILKPGGKLKIKVPHFSRGFMHPQHKAGFDISFPLYFDKRFKGGYYGVNFKCLKNKMRWMVNFDLKSQVVPRPILWILMLLNGIFNFVAWLSPYFCSRFWCFVVGGFEEIEFILQKK